MREIRAGLEDVRADTPIRGGYLEGIGGITGLGGPFAQGRIGYRPTENLSLHAAAEWNRINPWAGLGFEYRF